MSNFIVISFMSKELFKNIAKILDPIRYTTSERNSCRLTSRNFVFHKLVRLFPRARFPREINRRIIERIVRYACCPLVKNSWSEIWEFPESKSTIYPVKRKKEVDSFRRPSKSRPKVIANALKIRLFRSRLCTNNPVVRDFSGNRFHRRGESVVTHARIHQQTELLQEGFVLSSSN